MKDYKKILEGVVNIINTTENSDIGFANICTYIGENCHELKESEDEMIKTAILNHLKKMWGNCQDDVCGVHIEDAIAWLEKQGEKPQGKSALEAILEEKVNNANKIEPKLKIEKDKWYVCIRDLDDNYGTKAFCKGSTYYSTKDETLIPENSNIPFEIKYCVNDYFRPWTIKDAKDGDVLAFNDDTIVIFKDLYNKNTFHSYCHIEDGVFSVSEEDVPDWWNGEGFKPANKEQRKLLSQKMMEAECKWDAEKKELIKKEVK